MNPAFGLELCDSTRDCPPPSTAVGPNRAEDDAVEEGPIRVEAIVLEEAERGSRRPLGSSDANEESDKRDDSPGA